MFTRNFDVIKSQVLLCNSHPYVNSSGQPYFCTNESESWCPRNIYYLMRTMTTSYSNYGVILGTGDVPVDISDYQLSGSVISGYTYSYIQSRGIDEKYGAFARTKYTITNNNESAFTIREIGLVNSNPYCLIERQLLEVPLTIEGYGGVGQIEYTIYYDPTPVDYESNIDIDGVYGVEWNYSSSSPALKRFGSAADFGNPSPALSMSDVGSSPFDDIAPWSGMKRYNINNNVIGASEDDSGFDMTASDVVVYIPEFYYCVQDNPYNQKRRWAISATPRDGFEKHPGSGRYIGRYHTSVVDGEYCTRANQMPDTNNTINTDHNSSHEKGSHWWMMDIATWSAIQLLYLIEFATFDTWSVLGKGCDDASSNKIIATGSTNECAYHTLYANDGGNQYRWIENPYSNISSWVDGWEHYDYVWICLDNAQMLNKSNEPGYISSSVNNSYGGYMRKLYYVKKMPWLFIPYNVSGSQTTYVSEYSLYNTAGPNTDTYGYRCVVGEPYSSDIKSGFFYRRIYSGYGNSNIGSRLIYIP